VKNPEDRRTYRQTRQLYICNLATRGIRSPRALFRHVRPRRQADNVYGTLHDKCPSNGETGTPCNARFFRPKRHLDRFSRFCTAHPCVQHTVTQTERQTHMRAGDLIGDVHFGAYFVTFYRVTRKKQQATEHREPNLYGLWLQ